MSHPLLKVDEKTIVKEFNLGRIVGQIMLGVVVALSVRKIVAELDAWKSKRVKK